MNRPGQGVAADGGIGASVVADYISLVKPRVVVMITLTTLVGFMMGASGPIDLLLLIRCLLGTALVGAGTLALNQYLERDIDAKMQRTRHRPLPEERLAPLEAVVFGVLLAATGLLLLSLTVHPLSGLVTAATVIGYLFVYTPLKTRTALCTVIGAFPGALPPVTGWVAASGQLELGALLLFGMLFFWQLPHALAIAHLYREDFARAGIRLLPTIDRSSRSTGRQTVLNCIALISVGCLPAVMGMTGWGYFLVAFALGSLMLYHGSLLALNPSTSQARRLLIVTYVYIPVVLVAMTIDKVSS